MIAVIIPKIRVALAIILKTISAFPVVSSSIFWGALFFGGELHIFTTLVTIIKTTICNRNSTFKTFFTHNFVCLLVNTKILSDSNNHT